MLGWTQNRATYALLHPMEARLSDEPMERTLSTNMANMLVVDGEAGGLFRAPSRRVASSCKQVAPKTFKVNRCGVLKQTLLDCGWREAEAGEKAAFAYWDIFGDVPPIDSAVNNWPRRLTNPLDNIVTFFTYVDSYPGLADKVMPYTRLDWRDLTEEEFLDGADPAEGRLWFLKQAFGVGGKGITLLNSYAEYQACIRANTLRPCSINGPGPGDGAPVPMNDCWLIQKSVANVMTIAGGEDGSGAGWKITPYQAGGRKTLLRCYFISRGDGAFFMFGDALLYIHPVVYDPTSTDPAVNDSHGSGEAAMSILRPKAGQADLVRAPVIAGRKCIRLSQWEDQDSVHAITKHMLEAAAELTPVIHGVVSTDGGPERLCSPDADSETRMLYQFWGVDFLATIDNETLAVTGAKFIEMNAWPNMSHNRGVAAELQQHEDLDAGMMELLGFQDDKALMSVTKKQMWRQLSGPLMPCDHVPNYPPFGEGGVLAYDEPFHDVYIPRA